MADNGRAEGDSLEAQEPPRMTACTPAARRCTSWRSFAGAGLLALGLLLAARGALRLRSPARAPPSSLEASQEPSLYMQKEELFESDEEAEVPEVMCSEFPWIRVLQVIHNNLGNFGPDMGNEGMVYKGRAIGRGAREEMGKEVLVVVNATSHYTPWEAYMNGISGEFLSINIKSGSDVGLKFRIFDLLTGNQLLMPEVAVTFFDLDHGHDDTSIEHVCAAGYSQVLLSDHTEVKTEARDNGRSCFLATEYGNGEDNPKDAIHMTPQQVDRAITLTYLEVSEIDVQVGASKGMTPRFFTFIFRPALVCSLLNPEYVQEQEEGADGVTPPPQSTNRWPPLNQGIVLDPVVAPAGTSFVRWMAEKGDVLRRGDPVARVKIAGAEKQLEAPKKGVLYSVQDRLQEGDEIDEVMSDRNIAMIGLLPPFRKKSETDMRVMVQPGSIFEEYKVKVGDFVRDADTIATVSQGGVDLAVKAPNPGVVLGIHESLEFGDKIDNLLTDRALAMVGNLPPLGRGPYQEPVMCAPGSVVQQWYTEEGDIVRRGDPIVKVTVKGIPLGGSALQESLEQTLQAPQDGLVIAQQSKLHSGDAVDRLLSDRTLAVVGKLSPPQVGAGLMAVAATGCDKFIRFEKEVGDIVKKDEVLAVGTDANSFEVKIKAPKAGKLNMTQDKLRRGMRFDEVLIDRVIAVVGPFPPIEVPEDADAVSVPPGSTLKKWYVHNGDYVRKEQPVCEVTTSVLTRRLMSSAASSGGTLIVTSPRDGVIEDLAPIEPGQSIDDTVTGGVVGAVGPGEPAPAAVASGGGGGSGWPWWIWLLFIMVLFCCCLCVLLLMPRKKQETRSYTAMPSPLLEPQEEEAALAPLAVPPPDDDEEGEDQDGLKLVFLEKDGTRRVIYSKYRPLGIKMQHSVPIVIEDFKCNSYAKRDLQVGVGWTLVRIGREDVSRPGMDFSEVLCVLNEHQRSLPVWPLPVDFSLHNSEVKSFSFSHKPIGIEFTNKAPITVKKVHPNSPASRKGIKKGWVITRIGDHAQAENLEFRVLMKLLKEGVEALEAWDSNNPSMALEDRKESLPSNKKEPGGEGSDAATGA